MEFFYGHAISSDVEHEKIKKILVKYRHVPFSEELKKRIYSDLIQAKVEGKISIPFQVVVRKDSTGIHRAYVEVLLETQV